MVWVEYNDVYDKNRHLTGKIHQRGTNWLPGEYGMVVCVWVYDGRGNILLTKRAPEKSAAGTWENSGGAVRAGEDSLTAVVRELREETGIHARPQEFELLDQCSDGKIHYDHYCLKWQGSLDEIKLQRGETVDVRWADFGTIHKMIRSRQICYVIGRQFCKLEQALRSRQNV